MRRTLCLAILILVIGSQFACRRAAGAPTPLLATPAQPTATSGPPDPTRSVETPGPTASPAGAAPVAVATPTAVYTGPLSPACGVDLPPLLSDGPPPQTDLPITEAEAALLRTQVPVAAWAGVQRLLDAPGTVGLAAYQLGREAEGVFWNADLPMPLASTAKIITLAAYVEAAAAGEFNPLEPVPLSELERFYLPNFDLGAHRRAISELRAEGRILSPESDPAVSLLEVPWMMIRHSSNAAADYLHQRLGQARIEQTARSLGLADPAGSHSAPCNFLGQFLLMANHSRGLANDRGVLSAYLDGPEGAAAYGRDLALLSDAYVGQASFRQLEAAWRESVRRPTIDTQRYFAANLAPRGTPRAYAALMARLAQNGLSNPESSFQARRYLEWPNQFEDNQQWFSNVGYKNGSLPGVLTTAYYAYRWEDAAPVIVVLFYRDLPQTTYRRWRGDLPHDELARWLLADPAAIPALATAFSSP